MWFFGGKAAAPAAAPAEPDLAPSSAAGAAADAAPKAPAAPEAVAEEGAAPSGGAEAEKVPEGAKAEKEAAPAKAKDLAVPSSFGGNDRLLTDCVSSWGRFAGLSEEELATTTSKGFVDGPVIGSMLGSAPKEEATGSAAQADAVLSAFYKFGVTYKHYRFEALKAREKKVGEGAKVIAEGNETIKEITEVKLRREDQNDRITELAKSVEKRSNMVTISFDEKMTIDSYTIKTGEGDYQYDPVRWRFMGANSINGPWESLHAMEVDYDTPTARRQFLMKKPEPVPAGEKEPVIDPDDLVEWFYVTDLAAASGVDFDANLDGFFDRAVTNSLEEYEGSEHKAIIEKGFEKKLRETRVQRTVGTGANADRNFEKENPHIWSHQDDYIKKYRDFYKNQHQEEIMALAHKQRDLRDKLHKPGSGETRVVARDADKIQVNAEQEAIAASASTPETPMEDDWAKQQLAWLKDTHLKLEGTPFERG